MSLLNRLSALFQGFTDSAPWFIVDGLRSYLLAAAAVFVGLSLVDYTLLEHLFRNWMKRIKWVYTHQHIVGWRLTGAEATVRTLSEVGYSTSLYFGQVALAVAIFALVVALDLSVGRTSIQDFTDPYHPKPLPRDVQSEVIQATLAIDAIRLVIFGAAGFLFQHFVVLS